MLPNIKLKTVSHNSMPCKAILLCDDHICRLQVTLCTGMGLGLLPEDGVQADSELDALATGWQQRSIQGKGRRLRPVQRLQGQAVSSLH